MTGCKYNSSCCLSPYDFANKKCYCTRESISIDLNEDEDYAFTCINFESGYKDKQCLNCTMKDNDGEIPLGADDIFEIDIEEDDEEFLS
ncbi:MAG: hypothetical protein ACLRFL_02775 [Clostridia bacterium]